MSQVALLLEASRCFIAAGCLQDACRCLTASGHHQRAAPLYEQQENWPAAAHAYQQAKAWQKAAHCYLRNHQPLDAAECLLQAQKPIQAAWLFAEPAHHYPRARALVASLTPSSPAETLGCALIIARCEAGQGQPRKAGRLLQQACSTLAQLSPDPQASHLLHWALAIATHIERADLSATLYATAWYTGDATTTVTAWEHWANKTLGDKTGIPLPEVAEPLAKPAQ